MLLVSKTQEIREALADGDLERLRLLGRSPGGFLTRALRRRCWAMLLHCDPAPAPAPASSSDADGAPPPPSLDAEPSDPTYAPDPAADDPPATTAPTVSAPLEPAAHGLDPDLVHQVGLDVNRSFVQFKEQISGLARQHDMDSLRPALNRVILSVFRKYPWLSYYQGFHDVCAILLLVLGERLATRAAPNLALMWLRDFMEPSLATTMTYTDCLSILVSRIDPELARTLADAENDDMSNASPVPASGGNGMSGPNAATTRFQAIFAISWILTWFSHDVHNAHHASRLFDLFVSSSPLMPVYVAAAIVVSQKHTLMELDSDMALIHNHLMRSGVASSLGNRRRPAKPSHQDEDTPPPSQQQQQQSSSSAVSVLGLERVIATALDMYDKFPPETTLLVSERRKLGTDTAASQYTAHTRPLDPAAPFDDAAVHDMFNRHKKVMDEVAQAAALERELRRRKSPPGGVNASGSASDWRHTLYAVYTSRHVRRAVLVIGGAVLVYAVARVAMAPSQSLPSLHDGL
ncbi:rab-GTPase-TBC domain-containing protein [Entophlyctis helioformis]|nr:rab-GTPase-TBC domain-containing protein [Entophlyctis helioformis]